MIILLSAISTSIDVFQDNFKSVEMPAQSRRQLFYAIQKFIKFMLDRARGNTLGFFQEDGLDTVTKHYEGAYEDLKSLGAGLTEAVATETRRKSEREWQEENLRIQE